MPVLFGAKWGVSQANGTPGGVVTWSLAEAGRPGVRGVYGTNLADLTTEPGRIARGYDPEREIASAFAAWSRVANIDFVQFPDGGEPVGAGLGADIRVYFGQIDGVSGGTLAVAFFPFSQSDPRSGDLIFDAAETGFFASRSNFRAVAIHEIGHTIGLDHVTGVTAIMNPFVGRVSELQRDDIDGARMIYGQSGSRPPEIRVDASPDLTVLSGPAGLRISGDARANALAGGPAAELLRGFGGADTIMGGGGADTIMGGGGADRIDGGAGRDRILGGAGRDRIEGGAGADTLFGGAGNDVLSAGAGRDVLTGGPGADRFQFGPRSGFSTVTDFTPGTDLVDFSNRGEPVNLDFLSFRDVRGGAMVTDGTGTRVFLDGVSASELDLGDFLF